MLFAIALVPVLDLDLEGKQGEIEHEDEDAGEDEGVSILFACSADFQSAVSPISNRLAVRRRVAASQWGTRQNRILRYIRLEICATLRPALNIYLFPLRASGKL